MLFFFFKQKTAYEMRISDWSSDVCSSDLLPASLLPVKRTLSALMTMTLSPQSTCGVKLVLCLPRRTLAMIVAARPTTRPSASTICHFFRSEEHTSELQSLMRISYAVFCLTKKTYINIDDTITYTNK